MDFDSVLKAGSMLGSGGVIVLDNTMCIVKFALRVTQFYQHESCGWCIPCREGTDWMKKTLVRFHSGGGVAKDIDNLKYLAENMLGRTFCPLGDAAAMPIISYVQKFRQEFEDHLDGKPCPYEKAAEPVHGVRSRLSAVSKNMQYDGIGFDMRYWLRTYSKNETRAGDGSAGLQMVLRTLVLTCHPERSRGICGSTAVAGCSKMARRAVGHVTVPLSGTKQDSPALQRWVSVS